MSASTSRLVYTPDGRYLIVKGRLWRTTNPDLDAGAAKKLVADLMAARRAVAHAQRARDHIALQNARALVQLAKVSLGERGPVWWTDGSPDYNRHLVVNTPYANSQ